MQPIAKQERFTAFEEYCRGAGVPLTVQRRIILEAVLERDDHPSADQIYVAVQPQFQGISRTTVYRTLEMLARAGIITKACHPGKTARYDARTELHHHLVCLFCDTVIDIEDEQLDAVSLPDTSGYGFEVSDFRVQLRGTCKSCRKQGRGPAAPTDSST